MKQKKRPGAHVRARARSHRSLKRGPVRRAAVLEALRLAATRQQAAAAAGLSRVTLWRWLREDPELAAEAEQAEGLAELAMIRTLYEASVSDWKAAAWWLERRHPAAWGRGRRRVEGDDLETHRLAAFLAAEKGLDAEALIAEAERLVARYEEHRRRSPE